MVLKCAKMRRKEFFTLLTVELIRILPPAGIVRTMQAKRDRSSRRVLSEVFPPVTTVVWSDEINALDDTAPVPLLIVVSLTLTECTDVSESDALAAELACSSVKAWPSSPWLLKFKTF
jgi:hypothetical protein